MESEVTFLDDQFEAIYRQTLKNKKIVLVGPAETIKGSGLGDLIDEYDYVVRLNNAIVFLPFSAELSSDIGKRTDILYLSPTTHMRVYINEQREMLKASFRYAEFQFVNCSNNGNEHRKNQRLVNDYRFFIKNTSPHTMVRLVREASSVLEETLSELSGTRLIARTGLIALLDILLCEPYEVAVKGMTFYHGGGHLFRKSNAQLDPAKNYDGTKVPHDSRHELVVLTDLMKKYQGVLKIDYGLKELLKTT